MDFGFFIWRKMLGFTLVIEGKWGLVINCRKVKLKYVNTVSQYLC